MSYRRGIGQTSPATAEQSTDEYIRATRMNVHSWMFVTGLAVTAGVLSARREQGDARSALLRGLAIGALGITAVNQLRWAIWPISGGPIGLASNPHVLLPNLILGGPPSDR